MSIDSRINEFTDMVNEALDKYLPDTDCLQGNVCEAMRYSVMAGGKRIRPVLTLEFSRVCGGGVIGALPFACAVEMIHSYSLIHDDLPCMDDDELRRGKPSCHVKFGEATALLAGDALLSLAFETALCNNNIGKIKPEYVINAVHELAKASGAAGMVGGQIIDLESEGQKISLETLEFMHRKKTGEMIIAAAKMGCIVAGADETKIRAAAEYAQNIGLAFQIRDDIMDTVGDSTVLGKPAGSDEEKNKSTYITHLGIDKSELLVKKLTEDAIKQLAVFGDSAQFLSELAEYLAFRDR